MGSWKKEKVVTSIVVLFLGVFTTFAQTEKTERDLYIKPGLLSASATLSPTDMLNRKEINYYLTGFMEGRVHENISIRGDIHYLLPNADSKFLKNNIRLALGIQYGFPIKNFEVHMGFAPGFAVMTSNVNTDIHEFVPTAQLNIGARYYVWKYFHFFGNIHYIHSRMNKLNKVNGMADEMVYSVGLGFNFQTLKKNR